MAYHYEGLSQLPEQVQKSWFGFDHFYSDQSFGKALEIVFSHHPKRLLDIGGNTGRWATQCVQYNKEVEVTIVDLPQQLEMMRKQTAGCPVVNAYTVTAPICWIGTCPFPRVLTLYG